MKNKFVAAIIIKNKKVLLIRRSFTDKSEPGKWCPINESVEKNEPPQKAIIRGVKEEIGLKFTVTKRLPDILHKGSTTMIFLGRTQGKIKPDPQEVEEYQWFTYQGITQLDFAFGYEKIMEYLFIQKLIA